VKDKQPELFETEKLNPLFNTNLTAGGIFVWDKETEEKVLFMREGGATYERIANDIGITSTSVKHKVRRLQQNKNMERYKHGKEKQAQAQNYIFGVNNKILEMNVGFGGMTKFYCKFGQVECYDIAKDRVQFVNNLLLEGVTCINADSEHKIYSLISNKCIYDVVDIDPYGMPSRYFPMVFGLINNGILFVTLPMIGVAQINKITIRHLAAFWDVELNDSNVYIEKVFDRMKDYAFMYKREIVLLDCLRIDRVFRLCIKVQKKSCCDIVGLTVNRPGVIATQCEPVQREANESETA